MASLDSETKQQLLLQVFMASWASLVAQTVKNPPAVRVTWVQSLGWEDPLERAGHGRPLQHSCLENLHGQRSLVGYRPWSCKESDTTARLGTAHGVLCVFKAQNTSKIE